MAMPRNGVPVRCTGREQVLSQCNITSRQMCRTTVVTCQTCTETEDCTGIGIGLGVSMAVLVLLQLVLTTAGCFYFVARDKRANRKTKNTQ